jgi:hypothetical protein
MALGPTQVHPQQNLGPVGGFGAAGARTDRQQGVALVVFAPEEQVPPGPLIVGGEFPGLPGDLGQQAPVVLLLGQIEQLLGRLGARFQVSPELEFLAKTLGFAQRLLRDVLVVPETGLGNSSVQFG